MFPIHSEQTDLHLLTFHDSRPVNGQVCPGRPGFRNCILHGEISIHRIRSPLRLHSDFSRLGKNTVDLIAERELILLRIVALIDRIGKTSVLLGVEHFFKVIPACIAVFITHKPEGRCTLCKIRTRLEVDGHLTVCFLHAVRRC